MKYETTGNQKLATPNIQTILPNFYKLNSQDEIVLNQTQVLTSSRSSVFSWITIKWFPIN